MSGFRPPDFSGGGDDGGTTYGTLTNAQILAIASPSDDESAFSTDDLIVYVFFSGKWNSTAGGELV